MPHDAAGNLFLRPRRQTGMIIDRARALTILVLSAAALVGCAASPRPGATASNPASTASPITAPPTIGPAPTPSQPPSSSMAATVEVVSPAQAAALVFASNPLFTSIQPPTSDLLGASTSYTATESGPGYAVGVTIGTGDCTSGCIDQHTWTYSVGRDGSVELLDEQGPPVPPLPTPGEGNASVDVRVVAGPVCPVEREPPDPACAPRPVTGAEVVLRDPSGAEVARATSDEKGTLSFSVPAGAYWMEPQPTAGLMGTAPPVAFSVAPAQALDISVEYDTGIR